LINLVEAGLFFWFCPVSPVDVAAYEVEEHGRHLCARRFVNTRFNQQDPPVWNLTQSTCHNCSCKEQRMVLSRQQHNGASIKSFCLIILVYTCYGTEIRAFYTLAVRQLFLTAKDTAQSIGYAVYAKLVIQEVTLDEVFLV
jgi:hypothetical protein